MNEYLMIGEVLKPQGIRGEAKVKPYAADADDFLRWKTLYVQRDNDFEPIAARCSRVHDGFAYITLGACANPNDVERLRGTQLYIRREQTVQPGEDETFICDLIGCEAVDENGNVLGKLTDVLQHGPVDVYVFRRNRESFMAPALKAVFPSVDVAQRRIDVCTEKLQEVAVFED
ncbi:MAG: 16S rRNA processing protein RimM [Clostridia bacterium]|nr:16S rRNA processing protein RimM [Clostridia bacterium]